MQLFLYVKQNTLHYGVAIFQKVVNSLGYRSGQYETEAGWREVLLNIPVSETHPSAVRPTCPRNESNSAIRVMSPPFRGKSPVQTTIFSVK